MRTPESRPPSPVPRTGSRRCRSTQASGFQNSPRCTTPRTPGAATSGSTSRWPMSCPRQTSSTSAAAPECSLSNSPRPAAGCSASTRPRPCCRSPAPGRAVRGLASTCCPGQVHRDGPVPARRDQRQDRPPRPVRLRPAVQEQHRRSVDRALLEDVQPVVTERDGRLAHGSGIGPGHARTPAAAPVTACRRFTSTGRRPGPAPRRSRLHQPHRRSRRPHRRRSARRARPARASAATTATRARAAP